MKARLVLEAVMGLALVCGGCGSDDACEDGSCGSGDASEKASGTTAGESEAEESPLCSNACSFADDGTCDDCGPGSDYSLCELGTDCADCGPRESEDSCIDDGGSSVGGGGGGGGSSHVGPCYFQCEYCSGSVECSGYGCGTCQNLCQEACMEGGCGWVLSCF